MDCTIEFLFEKEVGFSFLDVLDLYPLEMFGLNLLVEVTVLADVVLFEGSIEEVVI